MAIYIGSNKISGNAKVVTLPMFFATYQPRKLNNASWLRADPYSWHSADLYVSAYAHLADNISGVTAQTETIAGTTITFYKLSDEIKVVLPDQETNLDAIYNATGIGYYFVLDTTNRQFKLPRNIYGFTGYRGDVGNYVPESLPNITGTFWSLPSRNGNAGASGAFTATQNSSFAAADAIDSRRIDFDASRSSSTYQNNAPVQQRATQAYLYFYVGNTVQNETSVNVGEITEEINEINSRPYVVETYKNGASWYRVYSDGWCEQGGTANVNNTTTTVTFLKPYIDTNYYCNCRSITTNTYGSTASIENRTATSMGIRSQSNATWCWLACGYIN